MIRQIPGHLLAEFVGHDPIHDSLGNEVPCAVAVDSGVAVAMPEPGQQPGPVHTWVLTVFDPAAAATAAVRVLREHGVKPVGATHRFGLPVVPDPAALLPFTGGLRLSGHPNRDGWILADHHASGAFILAGPSNSLTISWWDEYRRIPFAYPLAVAENRPSDLERAIAHQWGELPLHQFT
jgi:hypothetical protein